MIDAGRGKKVVYIVPYSAERNVYNMKKLLFFAVLLAAVLALGCASAAQTTTLLVYMCGTDIQEDACEDLYEMADVEAGDSINIVVLAGGASQWDLEDLEGRRLNFMVIRDGYIEELEDWGSDSMGKADTLAEFLEYGLAEYPADRTMVILWNHGAGSEGGICFDENADDDGLTIVEIDSALSAVQKSVPDFHIDIFGCDACMMATYEMAAMLSGYPIDYFVASEELEPGSGWYYTDWLNALADDPSITDEELCAEIIESFMDYGLAEEPDDYLTLSAVKLADMGALQASMEKFAAVMTAQIQGGNLSAVRRGRSRLYTFGSFDDGSWDMVDLGAALDAFAQFDPENAAEARKCLSNAVLYSSQTDNLDTCSGLSILIPQDTTNEFDEYRDGINLTDIIPNWIGFVNDYVSRLKGGSYQICPTGTCQISAGTLFDQPFVSVYSSPSGIWSWNDETESYGETAETEITVSDSDQGFTAVLPQEDLAYLDYVEGMLLIDISDEEMDCFVDLGLTQNNLINWQTGTVVSLFDGTWPTFGGQLVPMYDQTSNENSRRSLIPVKLNGVYTYLVVIFPADSTEGRIIGANAGYDDNGLPIRAVTKLKPGDTIVPVYTMYYGDEADDDLEETEFEGDPITWQDGMTVTYEDLSDEDEPMALLFCFVFNDIFGEDTMSEIVAFEI